MVMKNTMQKSFYGVCIALSLLIGLEVRAHDILLEAKAAYFLATSHRLKSIYHGGGIYGVEATAKWYKPSHWIMEHLYGFASIDVFHKKGKTVTFDTPTRVTTVNMAAGLKYFVPFCYGDFYVGLGVLPTYLQTLDDSPYVIHKRSGWGCGGIAKVGVILEPCQEFFVDIFSNYSFVNVPFTNDDALTESNTAKLQGCWFGVGFGHRFR